MKKVITTIRSFFKSVQQTRLMQQLALLIKKYHVVKTVFVLMLTVITLFTGYLVYSAKTMDVSSLKAGIKQETVVYDNNGEKAGSLSINKGTYVTLDQISPNMIDALLSTEDKRFYSHFGIDPIGMGRAAVSFITHFGKITGGGSTLTQQLAKNAYLTLDQTFMRKAKELFLSFEIEKRYTKDEILEMYLNNSYFGNGTYGVEDASQRYFGKSSKELTVDEAAILAGSLKAPSVYNPVDNMEKTQNRKATVLQLMVDNKKLTQQEADTLTGKEITVVNTYVANDSYKYPYYFDAVIDEVVNDYGISEEDLMEKGYQIYTGLNQTLQKDMTETFSQDYLFKDAEDGTKVQSASIALDPQTGNVLATIGGRTDGKHVFRGFNRATQMYVQPGSTFKPLAVYTPALEAGYTPSSLLVDEKKSYGTNKYTPENWNFEYQGHVTMTEAISMSWNAPAVWLLDQIGLQKGIEKVHQFGIPTEKEDEYLGVALGGLTKGASPIQMASAYTVFANNGIRSKARFVTKIVDATGAVIVDNTNPSTNRVTTPEVAETMTSMLLTVFSPEGGAASAAPNGYQIAGKSGTTESLHGENGTRDQWMIGYTPNIVVATWMGFDDSSKHLLDATSRTNIAPVFKTEMTGLLSYMPNYDFATKPANITTSTANEPSEWIKKAEEAGKNVWNHLQEWGNKATDWIKNKLNNR